MTTQKVQSKIKTSTIAITVLSILLAVAVASTIVLAAFTANKTATTTIIFAGGIQIDVTNITSTGSEQYAWDATYNGTDNKSGTITNAAADVTLKAISITNTSTATDSKIWVIAKASVTDVTVTPKTGWVALGSDGWYIYGSATAGTDLAKDGVAEFCDSTVVTLTEGKTVTATIEVYAVNAYQADALTQLKNKAGA